ncbi:hypothetical protein A2U01_0111460, partial [Trifolium medium]|nr:hypothetical protein [Trifolium medium]
RPTFSGGDGAGAGAEGDDVEQAT